MTRHRLSQREPRGGGGSGSPSFTTSHKTVLFLLGLTAGAAATAMAWWVKSDEPAIEPLGRNIDVLTRRLEQLGEDIAGLEAGLARLLVQAESSGNNGRTAPNDGAGAIPEPAETVSVTGPDGAAVAAEVEVTEPVRDAVYEGLTPTHSVLSRLNLRPSASMDGIPVAVLPAGTQVEKISKSGSWYYVDAGIHGKGWCFSDYLSPLL
jgi:hypothetical protein